MVPIYPFSCLFSTHGQLMFARPAMRVKLFVGRFRGPMSKLPTTYVAITGSALALYRGEMRSACENRFGPVETVSVPPNEVPISRSNGSPCSCPSTESAGLVRSGLRSRCESLALNGIALISKFPPASSGWCPFVSFNYQPT